IGATESGTTVTITTTAPHGYTTGQLVAITGVAVAGYNGNFTITVTSPTTFTYTAAAGLTASRGGPATLRPAAPGALASISAASSVLSGTGILTATITTTANHNFVVGQNVNVAGVGIAGYNGTFTILSVTTASPFTFTYVIPGTFTTNLGASSGGTALA